MKQKPRRGMGSNCAFDEVLAKLIPQSGHRMMQWNSM